MAFSCWLGLKEECDGCGRCYDVAPCPRCGRGPFDFDEDDGDLFEIDYVDER